MKTDKSDSMRGGWKVAKTQDGAQQKKIKKPQWYRRTERLLREFKYMPIEIDNLLLQLKLDRLAGPSTTFQPREIITQHMNSGTSSTESAFLKEESLSEHIERKQILYEMLENTIKSFNPEEALVYKMRYESEFREKVVSGKLKMGKSTYFELQRRVVLKAARMLHIPVPTDDQPQDWTGELFSKCAGHFLD